PLAGAVAAGQASTWQATAFLQSTGSSWLETSPLERGVLRFEPEQGDQAGPLAIGLSLTRRTPPGTGTNASEQRVVVIANSGFLSNEYINTHGNRQLAMAVFRWLAQRDAQIDIAPLQAPDASLHLAPAEMRLLWLVFVGLLPAILLLVGVGRWALRRRR